MYNILFVSALSWELKLIKEKIKKLNIPNLKVDFFSTWMWNYNTILHLTRYLSDKTYDFLINIWSCWHNNLNKYIYQVARIINVQNDKELLVPINIKVFDLITSYCFEKPVLQFNKKNCIVDMESYWFEIVADSFLLPRLILKIPVDNMWEKFDKNIFIKNIDNINFKIVLKSIKLYLDTLPVKEKLDIYIDHFKFTFSQKHIFTKLYYKYIALKNDDFEQFFNDNKHLLRKEFLKKLEDILDI